MTKGSSDMNVSVVLLIALIAFLSGEWYGWVQSHHVVATECERLGKFYVGKKVYSCVKIEEKE